MARRAGEGDARDGASGKSATKPSDILTRDAFLNAIVVNSAIGGSTNAPIHINAIAKHIGVPLTVEDWQTHGHDVPLLVNLQPAGEYLGEDFHRAGGVPAVVAQLMGKGLGGGGCA
ncbi:dihydroxy-acid dehydratase [Azospirillum brasilense]|uniref:dihydroxy-acid dehydratase domain-containing protein n=1 Tax=Azospirillum brasilense TaxID=192 RepID=UPI003B967F6C